MATSQHTQQVTVELNVPYKNFQSDELEMLSRQARVNQLPPQLITVKHSTVKDQSSVDVFDSKFQSKESIFKDWMKKRVDYCNGKYVGYANRFVQHVDILLDPSKVSGASGGEKLKSVLKQRESKEFLTAKKGIFRIDCDKLPKYKFDTYLGVTKGYIPALMRYTLPRIGGKIPVEYDVEENMAAVVMRYDYANLFHALNDVFNVFLLHIFLHKNPKETNIVIIDGHPEGHVDPVWKHIFKNVTRVRHLTKPVLYKNMIWNMFEKWCPLNDHSLKSVPHLADFRNFVLDSYGIQGKPRAECSDSMSVLFVWRRDYLAHPRNPTGKIDRKIKNEDEILSVVKRKYPNFKVVGKDLASLDFKQQLQHVANVDIVVGMHGAGLSHMLFMPYNGGLIELMQYKNPVGDIKPRLVFKTIARWKKFTFLHWQNRDKGHDLVNGYTYVPPGIILGLLDQMVDTMCN